MQVRSGCSSGHTYKANDLAALDPFALFYADSLHMREFGYDAPAVIDLDAIAIGAIRRGEDNRAFGWRDNRRAHAITDVKALVELGAAAKGGDATAEA